MSKRDYYEILGLTKASSDEDIKLSYRRLAMKHHPDRNPGDGASVAEEKFKEAKEAYEVLSDPERRRQYDIHGHNVNNSAQPNTPQWSQSGNPGHFDEMFKTFFNARNNHFNEGLFGQQAQQQTIHVVTISLVDAYIGKTIKVDANVIINIPKGARSGTKLFANNKLYRIDVLPHYKFKRSNDDLLIDVQISAIEAMLGLESILEHLDSVKLQFAIPPGIQHGQIVKLANKGMKNPETDRYGDVLVRISVIVPRTLTEDERAVLKTLIHRESIII